MVVDGKKFAFHLLPCGLIYEHTTNLLGNGTVIHLPQMFNELAPLDEAGIEWRGRLKLSDRAHLLFDFHQAVDGIQEVARGGKGIGTTRKGIGPAYASKASRTGVRVGSLQEFDSFVELVRPRVLAVGEGSEKRRGGRVGGGLLFGVCLVRTSSFFFKF